MSWWICQNKNSLQFSFDISMMDVAGSAHHNNPDLEKWWEWEYHDGGEINSEQISLTTIWWATWACVDHVSLCPPVQWNLAPAIANLRKGLRLVFSSPHPPFAEIGKSKNVNLDFLFGIILCKYHKCRYLRALLRKINRREDFWYFIINVHCLWHPT